MTHVYKMKYRADSAMFFFIIRAGERVRLRHLRDASDPYQLRDRDFIKFFRLSKELARHLTEELRPHIPEARRVTAVALEIKVSGN